jgi:pyridoxal phosphate enzyme (YggS family)
MTSAFDAGARLEELSTGLALIDERIAAACKAAERPRDDVQLIVVTKYFPGRDIEALCQLGVTHVAESRDQEASTKIADLPASVRARLHVHFIGQLQSNKARTVAGYSDTVHSVDRNKVVVALDSAAALARREIGALVQVRLSEDLPGGVRGGIAASGVADLARMVDEARHLTLRGVMAVAPPGVDPGVAFAELATVAGLVRANHPGATWISAGMSADLEAAVACGATHLRVGSAILGSRPRLG